jgi:hypothetical protein
MSARKWAVGVFATLAAASATLVLAQEVTTQPSARARLPRDYAQITSLTDDQKSQILAIRETTDSEVRRLEAKEKDDELAVLNDDQKTELKQIDEKLNTERLARQAEARRQERIDSTEAKLNELKDGQTPTTNPSGQN